ncbi:hypothetical protein AGMMS49949_09540 [Alphaproteobacteria bacterium]|nr:hypothetical protein AGMMS49949_09540 [Alphaproteobacteria bacterium]GHS96528.1 hypothetical protein AGMMS50296_2770 [Alphaproteobacteria bacterium]
MKKGLFLGLFLSGAGCLFASKETDESSSSSCEGKGCLDCEDGKISSGTNGPAASGSSSETHNVPTIDSKNKTDSKDDSSEYGDDTDED